jgi:hypothetical protein
MPQEALKHLDVALQTTVSAKSEEATPSTIIATPSFNLLLPLPCLSSGRESAETKAALCVNMSASFVQQVLQRRQRILIPQGNLTDAQKWVVQAVSVSPGNIEALLSAVYIEIRRGWGGGDYADASGKLDNALQFVKRRRATAGVRK